MRAKVLWLAVVALGGVLAPEMTAQVTTGVTEEEQQAVQAGRARGTAAVGEKIAALVAEPAVSRAHWGVSVRMMDGTADGAWVYGLNEGQFFQPASNAKLFTTAAAMALLGPERTFETRVLGPAAGGCPGVINGNLLLVGGGDAFLSGREVPYVATSGRPVQGSAKAEPLRFLEGMADDLVRGGLRSVSGDVVGDDGLFVHDPYPPDWAIDDMVWGYGSPVSALSVADNEMELRIAPGKKEGVTAEVELRQAVPFYTLDNEVLTVAAKGAGEVHVEREAGSRVLRVYGVIARGAAVDVEQVAIADPAEYAAMLLKKMLEERGVTVRGKALALHRMPKYVPEMAASPRAPDGEAAIEPREEPGPGDTGEPCCTRCAAESCERMVLASHRSPRVAEDVVVTNKTSENLHAEILLRQMGAAGGRDGSTAEGTRVVRQFLVGAGIDKDDFVFYDGSGLSGHDLVTPRATVRLLTWASGQPWFSGWRASLPVGGVDGTLQARFAKGPLKGKVFAKTGTLGEARALSGYMECASGRTVAFSVMVTNHAPGGHADQEVMDRIVGVIWAAE